MSRRINFSLNTSMAAFVRSSVDEVMVMASSPCHSMWVSVPRKSNRVDSSLAAWLRALSTSCRSTLLTTSKLESAIALASSRCARKYYPTTAKSTFRRQTASKSLRNVDLDAGADSAVFVQSTSSLYPASRTMAGCPSGQWERTVNPSAYAYAGSNPAPATTCHQAQRWYVAASRRSLLRHFPPTGDGAGHDQVVKAVRRMHAQFHGQVPGPGGEELDQAWRCVSAKTLDAAMHRRGQWQRRAAVDLDPRRNSP